MKNLFADIINIQPGVTLAIVLLLLLRPWLKKNYRAKLRYMLWLVVALRLALPFSFNFTGHKPVVNIPVENYYITQPADPGRGTEFEFIPRAEYEMQQENLQQSQPAGPAPTENLIVMREKPAISLVDTAAKIWLFVAAMLLAYSAISYILAKKEILSAARKDKELTLLLKDIKTRLGITGKVAIRVADYTGSPMLIGFVKPVIILPDGRYSTENLAMIICHELTHLKRMDILYKFLLHTVKCIHWFNPLVWAMVNRANRDVERCCDEDIVKDRNKNFRSRYAETILQVVAGSHRTPALSTAFSNNAKTVKERFANIFFGGMKKQGKNILAGFLAVVILATTVVGCGSENKIIDTEPEKEISQTVKVIDFLDLSVIDTNKIYYVRDTIKSSNMVGQILVTDLENQTTDYLCKNTDCDHENENCVAFIDITNSCSVKQLDENTLLLKKYELIDNEMNSVLLTMDLNGDNRKPLFSFKSHGIEGKYPTQANIFGQINDNLYMSVSDGVENYLLRINYKTGETEYIPVGDYAGIVGVDENNVYLSKRVHDNGVDEWLQSEESFTTAKFNITDKTIEDVYFISKEIKSNIMSWPENNCEYITYNDGSNLNMLCRDFTDGKETVIFENLVIENYNSLYYAAGFEDVVIFNAFIDGGKGQPMFYNISTGESGKITLVHNMWPEYIYPKAEFGDYIVVQYGETAAVKNAGTSEETVQYRYGYSLIKKSDYLAGNPNFIQLPDIV